MKDLFDCINEASKKDKEIDVVIGGKVKKSNIDKLSGKSEDKNGSDGTFAVDAPTDDDVMAFADKNALNANERVLKMRMAADKDFFIMGHAGWGKSQIIKKMAKKFGRTVITVFLDKAVKEDLGGIPIPDKSKKGNAVQRLAMPAWAAVMHENPDTQYLLFFDEMNQADPGVMNALMPIVEDKKICNIKFDNYIVGAAGNYHDENNATEELSVPLRSRFGGIIYWEDSDPASWAHSFEFLHKNWDGKLGEEFVKQFETHAMIFNNPREVESKIFDYIFKLKQKGITDDFEPNDYLKELQRVSHKDLERTEKDDLVALADYIYNYMNTGNAQENKPRSRGGRDQFPKEALNMIKDVMETGYCSVNGVKYGVSRDSVYYILDPETSGVNAEIIDRIISKYEAEGIKFKYDTDDDFKSNKSLKKIPRD